MLYNEREGLLQLANKDIPWMKNAVDFIEQVEKDGIQDGRHEILEGKVYANVETYETKAYFKTRFEAHKKYIDIQYMISGKEEIGVCDIKELQVNEAYNVKKDVVFFEDSRAGEKYSISNGQFLVFFPADAHRPCIAINDESQKVQKMVIKVAIE